MLTLSGASGISVRPDRSFRPAPTSPHGRLSSLCTGARVVRPVVFPLWPILPGNPPTCGCGNTACTRVGKHPQVAWGEICYGDPVPRPEPGAGVGLKTGAHPKGSDCFVVDLDGPEAAEAFAALGPCPETWTIRTPRGRHLYFQHPGFPVKTCAGLLAKGIDIRGEGGFVVAEGSPHRSGGRYEPESSAALGPVQAPEWLLTWLREQAARAPATTPQRYPGDVTDPGERAYRRKLYAVYLRDEAPPRGEARRGRGDATLFEVVQRGAYDLALPEADVLDLVRTYYDPRCSPMWGAELAERVHHKCKDAKTNSTRPRMEPMPEEVAESIATKSEKSETVQERIPSNSILHIESTGWAEPLPPMEWTIADTLVRATINTWIGDPDALKTWVAMHACTCVAGGRTFLGRAVKQGRAALIDYETGKYQVRKRIRILGPNGLDGQFFYAFPDVPLNDERLWKDLAELNLSLTVVDSLSRGCPTTDENTSAIAVPMAMAKKYLCESSAGTSCIFIHHLNKQGTVRGSTAIRAASDMVFEFVRAEGGGQQTAMKLDRTKVCDRSDVKEFSVVLTDARGIELAPAGLSYGKPLTLDERVLLELEAAGTNGIRGYRNLAAKMGETETIVHSSLKRLAEADKIFGQADGVRRGSCEPPIRWIKIQR